MKDSRDAFLDFVAAPMILLHLETTLDAAVRRAALGNLGYTPFDRMPRTRQEIGKVPHCTDAVCLQRIELCTYCVQSTLFMPFQQQKRADPGELY